MLYVNPNPNLFGFIWIPDLTVNTLVRLYSAPNLNDVLSAPNILSNANVVYKPLNGLYVIPKSIFLGKCDCDDPLPIVGLLIFLIKAPNTILSLKEACTPKSIPKVVDLDDGKPKVPSPLGPAEPAWLNIRALILYPIDNVEFASSNKLNPWLNETNSSLDKLTEPELSEEKLPLELVQTSLAI